MLLLLIILVVIVVILQIFSILSKENSHWKKSFGIALIIIGFLIIFQKFISCYSSTIERHDQTFGHLVSGFFGKIALFLAILIWFAIQHLLSEEMLNDNPVLPQNGLL